MENKHTIAELKQMQSLSLESKVRMTITRIKAWVNEYGEDGVSISFSGGKDSTVLMDIIRNEMGMKNIPAVFVDVPTQFPELRDFVKTWENVEILKPKISFLEVCEKYGFPLISKEVSDAVFGARKNFEQIRKAANIEDADNFDADYLYKIIKEKGTPPIRVASLWGDVPHKEKGILTNEKSKRYDFSKYKFFIEAQFAISSRCCNEMKKKPLHEYQNKTQRHPITAQMAEESQLRTTQWLIHGCNGFNMKIPISNPMSFWTEQDILQYIKTRNLPICSVYGDVVVDHEAMGEMAGQSFLFETGSEPLKTTGCKRTGCMLCGFGCHLNDDNRFIQLKETHPKMYNLLDVCKNNGVTFREAIEWTNEHGNLNIKL